MMHVSRMSEELVIWMSPRVGFIDIADRFCTGSSIMPQKKNPDVPELARGKTGRVYGHLMGLLTLMKGQPLAYNKDNQEDKEPLFDTVDTVLDTLRIFADMAARHHRQAGQHARRRAAGLRHRHRPGRLPGQEGPALPRRPRSRGARRARLRRPQAATCPRWRWSDLQAFSPLIEEDVFAVLTLEGSVAARDHVGGTAPNQVKAAIARVRGQLGN